MSDACYIKTDEFEVRLSGGFAVLNAKVENSFIEGINHQAELTIKAWRVHWERGHPFRGHPPFPSSVPGGGPTYSYHLNKAILWNHCERSQSFEGYRRHSVYCADCGMEAYVTHQASDTENDPNYQPRYCTACGSAELETRQQLSGTVAIGPYVLWIDPATGLVRCHDERTNKERLCVL